MQSLKVISSLSFVLLLYGLYEFYSHQNKVQRIPFRIHVNGTRGKSSVTRCSIGAGLRAAGYETITKVRGTFPRLILNDGMEVFIHRKIGANILEQIDIVDFAVRHKAQVLLIEFMALNPINQWITEHRMIRCKAWCNYHCAIGSFGHVFIRFRQQGSYGY